MYLKRSYTNTRHSKSSGNKTNNWKSDNFIFLHNVHQYHNTSVVYASSLLNLVCRIEHHLNGPRLLLPFWPLLLMKNWSPSSFSLILEIEKSLKVLNLDWLEGGRAIPIANPSVYPSPVMMNEPGVIVVEQNSVMKFSSPFFLNCSK